MNLQMLKKWPELSLLAVFCLLALILFTVTTPAHVPPAVLVLSFFVLFGIFFSGFRLLGRVLGLKPAGHQGLPAGQRSLSRLQYNGLVIGAAALPVILLALQSIGQLTVKDTITLAIIFVAGYFYISRQQP